MEADAKGDQELADARLAKAWSSARLNGAAGASSSCASFASLPAVAALRVPLFARALAALSWFAMRARDAFFSRRAC